MTNKIAIALLILALAACDQFNKTEVMTQLPAALSALPTVMQKNCFVDQAAPIQSADGVKINVVGWAYNGANGTVPTDVYIKLTPQNAGAAVYVAGIRGAREDVAKVFNNPALASSGVSANFSGAGLVGLYSISLLQADANVLLACETDKNIDFGKAP
ncbi:MAG: hypothetical protein ABL925_04645 [Methylococcales bacterium]